MLLINKQGTDHESSTHGSEKFLLSIGLKMFVIASIDVANGHCSEKCHFHRSTMLAIALKGHLLPTGITPKGCLSVKPKKGNFSKNKIRVVQN